jgi:TonB family protein
MFAECGHPSATEGNAASGTVSASATPPAEVATDQRTVLLSLVINKSGSVRDATLVSGPLALRDAAIKAAKHRKYKSELMNGSTTPHQMTVAVTFAPDKDTAPEIQEARPAGVPGCVYVSAIRISGPVMQTYLLSRIDPVYPAEALAQHVDGPVVLRVRIDKNGNVFQAEKVSGADVLVPAAIEAVKQWKYKPYLLDWEPMEVSTTVEIGVTSPVP